MRRKIIALLCAVSFLAQGAFANPILERKGATNKSVLQQLQSFAGPVGTNTGRTLTFYKNFANLSVGEVSAAQLAADFSVGSATATFTASRDATHPATWIDNNGLIHASTTANVGRVFGGYYDSTGFHAQKGLMMERASTNYQVDSYFLDGTETYWHSRSNTTMTNDSTYVNPYGGGKCQKVVITVANGGIQTATTQRFTVTSGETWTLSYMIRGSGTMNSNIGNSSGVSATHTLTDSWCVYRDTFSMIVTGAAPAYLTSVSDTCTFYVAWVQVEKQPYGTSLIPTTTAALTRNAESLGYLNSGNSTAATESIFIKFAPEATWANDNNARYLQDTDTKRRIFYKAFNSNLTKCWPNYTDTSGSYSNGTTQLSLNTSYVAAVTMQSTGDPNSTLYINGTAEGAVNNTDYTSPAWGTNFYIGCQNDSTNQLDGIIQAVCRYSDMKSAGDTKSISTIFTNN